MITRTDGEDGVVLHARDQGYDIRPGDIFWWSDSLCSRMVRGEDPHIAPNAQQVEAYRQTPIGQEFKIGAYIGVPITKPDGSLFGTLCAIDPKIQASQLVQETPLIELIGGLLSTVLDFFIQIDNSKRREEF